MKRVLLAVIVILTFGLMVLRQRMTEAERLADVRLSLVHDLQAQRRQTRNTFFASKGR